jgi:thioredoxin reductase
MSNMVDVLILGGGPAGLGCATALARQLHTAIVFNSGVFRNERAKHMHNVLGWDHRNPADFRAQAQSDIFTRYKTIQFKDVEIKSLNKLPNGRFEAVDSQGGKYEGRKVVLANGITDVMPDIPGYSDLWGRGIFHCLFCHGYEDRDAASAGTLATGFLSNPKMASTIARSTGRLAATVNVYTNGDTDLAAEVRLTLKNTQKFRLVTSKILKLEKDPEVQGDAGIIVTLEDGTVNKEGFMAHAPNIELNGPFAKDLGLDIAPEGHISTTPPFNNTSLPGVFAAGDCATLMRAVSVASMMGSTAAAGIAHTLQAEDDTTD